MIYVDKEKLKIVNIYVTAEKKHVIQFPDYTLPISLFIFKGNFLNHFSCWKLFSFVYSFFKKKNTELL